MQAISEILLIKCEDDDECQGGGDFLNDSNDNAFDDGADNNNGDSSSSSSHDDDSKDKDFHLSDYEKKPVIRVKRKYVKKADRDACVKTEKSDEIQQIEKTKATDTADPNALKKKAKLQETCDKGEGNI